ncbi:MAG: dihydrodipicolinate synthase family protein [Anaerolineaceae bacterium]|nr:dihydrodipicolinate synthase family protein [Anaerolineaceae bacterium]
MKFEGIYPAVATPFTDEGKLNRDELSRLLNRLITSGMHGFYMDGTTGEGLLLTEDERKATLDTALEVSAGQVPVILHVGAFDVTESFRLAQYAEKRGAAGIASLPPAHFLALDEESVFQYYKELSSVTDLPVLLYHLPAYSHFFFTTDFYKRLSELPNVVGMKDSHGLLVNFIRYRDAVKNATLFIGSDIHILTALQYGADGCVSGPANIMPETFTQLWNAFHANDLRGAAAAQRRIADVFNALPGVSPILWIKQILNWQGYQFNISRKPGRSLSAEEQSVLRQTLDAMNFFD